jgi:hypothetical protein
LVAIPAARGADFQLGLVGEGVEYSQTSSAAPGAPSSSLSGNTSPFDFAASVLGQPISVSSATVTGGPHSLNDPLSQDSPGANFYRDLYQSSLSNLEGFDGTYSLQVNTVHDGTKTFNDLSLSGDSFPGASHITNWSALQSANVNQGITVDWTPSNVSADTLAVLGVSSVGNGPDVFETPLPSQPGVLTGATTSVTIPAGTLLAGETYTVELLELNPVSGDTSTYPGALVGSGYASDTVFDITTVPEPASISLLVLGSVPMLMRRRRQRSEPN